MDKSITDHEIIAMLEWYKAAGIDEAIASGPGDWFSWQDRAPQAQTSTPPQRRLRDQRDSQSSRHPPGTAAPGLSPSGLSPSGLSPSGLSPSLTTPPDEAVFAAREKARSAKSLDELYDILKSFTGCGLSKTATNICFYRGSPDADIMLIGEAPGRDEDIAGKPFVGQAGQLLDKMLAAIELDETQVHITNIIYWRPPGNRTPTPLETQICQPFILRQLQLVAPKLVIFLGGSAAKAMLNTNQGIMRLRGKWRDFKYAGDTVKSMATLHPAYLLRTPAAKRLAWRDLLEIRAELTRSS